MRKLLLFTLVATLFTACTEDVIDEQRNVLTDDNRTLTVSLDGDANDTRIQLNEEKKTVWTEGDLLSVFYRSTTNEQWQFMGKTGDRTGNVEPVDSSIIPTPTTNDIVVVYPYNAGYFYNSDTKSVQASLPATQSYLKDSYGLNGNIMVSLSKYNQVALKSVCGWLKLQLTGNGEKIKSITLRGNNGEQVAGELYINSADATSTLASKLTDSDDDSDDDSEVGGTLVRPGTILKEVTLDCGKGVVLDAEATAFYIALPPMTFEKGLTVEITAVDGSAMTQSTDNEVVIERNHIQPMTTFVYDGVRPQPNNEIWYTATAKVVPYDKTVFGATYVSNEWNSKTGKGVITFSGDVTKIGDYAFSSCCNLTNVTIPDSVTIIGETAFYYCDRLTSVTIPESVTTIGQYAFYNCTSLTSVTIPDSVTTIGDYAFRSCTRLTSVTIGNSVTTIGEEAFAGCKSLKEFKGKFAADGGRCLIIDGMLNAFALGCGVTQYTIPDSVTTIGGSAFSNCSSLTSVTIPDSVTTIGNGAFHWCTSLESVTIGNSVTTIGDSAFSDCHSLTSVTIGDSVTTIGECAFGWCDSLTSVTIGDSVTTIGRQAFFSCNNLKTVYCKPTTPPTGGSSMFNYNASDRKIYVPASDDDSIIKAYKAKEYWSSYADYIFEEE